MNIYFSGLGGVGIGPLALIARDAGHTVLGSDMQESHLTRELSQQFINISIGQDGSFLAASHATNPIDWFVYTAALPPDHPELMLAKELGIKTGKRDEFLANFIDHHNLKLIAVAGTHGKTTTTGMMVWALKQLGIPTSYSVGTTLSFGPSGAYVSNSEYFVYECDEFDRNFLNFSPFVSIITSIDYDHPDTYPSKLDYTEAFAEYIAKSSKTIMWRRDADYINLPETSSCNLLDDSEIASLNLPGEHNRRNATLVIKALSTLAVGDEESNIATIDAFPGTDRRFEKLGDNLYSDYGHHPIEISATLQLAKELAPKIALIYQPHQNIRQHELRTSYTEDVFSEAAEIYWLPTYLSRENPNLEILTPQQLTAELAVRRTENNSLHYAEMNDSLWQDIQKLRSEGVLVLAMGAGSIDGWIREQLAGEAK